MEANRAVGQTCLSPERGLGVEGDLGVTGICVVFKATRPDETTWEEDIDRRGRSQATAD